MLNHIWMLRKFTHSALNSGRMLSTSSLILFWSLELLARCLLMLPVSLHCCMQKRVQCCIQMYRPYWKILVLMLHMIMATVRLVIPIVLNIEVLRDLCCLWWLHLHTTDKVGNVSVQCVVGTGQRWSLLLTFVTVVNYVPFLDIHIWHNLSTDLLRMSKTGRKDNFNFLSHLEMYKGFEMLARRHKVDLIVERLVSLCLPCDPSRDSIFVRLLSTPWYTVMLHIFISLSSEVTSRCYSSSIEPSGPSGLEWELCTLPEPITTSTSIRQTFHMQV